MTRIKQLDHVGITVSDLDEATRFFVGLGLEVEGRATLEGEFLDTVCGLSGARSEIVMLRPPDGGPAIELGTFQTPEPEPGSPDAMANELGIRNVCFEIEDLPGTVERLGAEGYRLVGGIGNHEDTWLMAYVRGPDGIVVSLAEQLG